VDGGRLRPIDPRHREAAATGSLRARLRENPASLLLLNGFFESGVADALARFLGEDAGYRSEYRLFSATGPVDEARWSSVDDRDRLWTVQRVAGAESSSILGRGAIEYVRVRSLLHSTECRSFLEVVSSRSLGDAWGVGACRLDAGDYVRPHRYDPATCGLRLEVFLSPEWDPAFGAELCVIDQHERVTRLPALFNCAVVLDTSVGNTYYVAPRRQGGFHVPRLSLEACYRPSGG
jgi:hypothetical protein